MEKGKDIKGVKRKHRNRKNKPGVLLIALIVLMKYATISFDILNNKKKHNFYLFDMYYPKT